MKMKLLVFFLMLALSCGPSQAALPSCDQVVPPLMPCFPYLKGRGGPTSTCCKGVGGLIGVAGSKPGLELICKCLKEALKDADYDPNLIPTVTAKCGLPNVGLPPISQATNCAGI